MLGLALTSLDRVPRMAAASRAPGGDAPCLAIEDVTVLSMAPGSAPQANMTVLIEGERIARIAPAAEFTPPGACTLLDGRGQWLIPGLIDMHAHFLSEPIPALDIAPEDILTPQLANGVLQIVDMAATPETNAIRDAVAAGEITAPFIASAAMIDGAPAIRPVAREITSPDQAREVVEEIAAAGFDLVKVYSRLAIEDFAAVLDAADAAGIRVVGHFPGSREAPVGEILQPGFAMVAHAEEFAWSAAEKSDVEIAAYTELMLESGAALTSTRFLNEQILAQTRDPSIVAETEGLAYVHPALLSLWFEENPYLPRRSPERIASLEAVTDFNARLVKAFVEAGIPVFAGTDASFVPGVAPGFALHEELAALVAAGLSPLQALEAATVAPATWLGIIDDRGTVEVGKRANLVMVSADPLADIEHTRAITTVVFNGEAFDRVALDARLAALDEVYAQYRPFFSPVAANVLTRHEPATPGTG